MKSMRILSSLVSMMLVWAAVFCDAFGEDAAGQKGYTISKIYEYNGEISAVDIAKNSEFDGTDNVLVLAIKESGLLKNIKKIELDGNMPVGINEITVGDFPIGENQNIFAAVWEDFDSIRPMTDGSFPAVTHEGELIIGNENDWEVSGNGKRLTAYTGSDTEIQIPNYLGGKHITGIGPIITGTITSIFGSRSEEITAVSIPEGIVEIGNASFFGCKAIQNELVIPSTVEYIGTGAFYNCIKMPGDIVIPEKTTTIAPLSFAGCYKITSVSFGENLKILGDYAFYYCKSLSGNLVIPDSVIKIGNYAFTYCSALSGSLSLGGGLTYIGAAAFAKCRNLSGNLILPDGLVHIGASAFEDCGRFTGALYLPENLEYIGDAAFNHCTGFTNSTLLIPAKVSVLGGDLNVDENTNYSTHLFYDFGTSAFETFSVDAANKNFTAADGVLYTADMTRLIAYPRGKRDTVYEIPEGVTVMDELSFSKNPYLTELILPDSYIITPDIPANALNHDANSLSAAIYNYTGITKVSVKDTNPNYLSENGIIYSKDKKSLWYCPSGYSGAVDILIGTERIENGAFYGASGYINYTKVTVPASVTFIHPNAVSFLNYLLPGSVEVAEGNPNYTVTDGKLEAVN